MGWNDNLNWQLAANWTRSRVPQLASLIPLAGYALLWSDEVGRLLSHFPALGGIWFTPTQRILLVYIGGLLVLAGLLAYWTFCPREVRNYKTADDYARAMVSMGEAASLEKAAVAIRSELLAGGIDPHHDPMPKEEWQTALFLGRHPVVALIYGIRASVGASTETITSDAWGPQMHILLAAYYNVLSLRRRWASWPCLMLYTLGIGAFFTPALEVAVLVVRAIPQIVAPG